MAYVITPGCVGVMDRGCVEVCPVDCIFGAEDDVQLYIDPDECIDCGNCVSACPVRAIVHQDDAPAEVVAANAARRR